MNGAATLNCQSPEQRDKAVQRAAELLRRGGLVVFPTETVYGVGAGVLSDGGVDRLRRTKGRSDDKPFTVHVPTPESVERYVDVQRRPTLRRLVSKTMPGPITLVVELEEDEIARKLAEGELPEEARRRLYHERTIGLRCPDDPVAAALLGAVGQPVVASSANHAGEPAPLDADQAARALGDEADLVLDGGPCRFGRASTIVRLRDDRAEVLREGVYDKRYLDKLMRREILFLCSGNTCRSPMAEAIARHEAAERGAGSELTIRSAGAFAVPGAPITPEAARALEALSIPSGHHVTRPLSMEMLQQADVIYCMNENHREAVAELLPSARAKAELLDPEGNAIEDPIGGDQDAYVQCAERLRQLVRRRLDEWNVGSPSGSAAGRSAH